MDIIVIETETSHFINNTCLKIIMGFIPTHKHKGFPYIKNKMYNE